MSDNTSPTNARGPNSPDNHKPPQKRHDRRLPGGPPPQTAGPNWRPWLWLGLLAFWLIWIWQVSVEQMGAEQVPYSEFKARLAAGQITEVVVQPDVIEGIMRVPLEDGAPAPLPTDAVDAVEAEGDAAEADAAPAEEERMAEAETTPVAAADDAVETADAELENVSFRTVRMEDPDLVKELQAANVKFRSERPNMLTEIFWAWVIPIGLLIVVWIFLSRYLLGRAGAQAMTFGKSKAKIVAESSTGVNFDDVAGCEEAKAELEEVVDFLKNPGRYQELGANIPKGVLLVGPPGTGKTLLAKAVAGEAGVTFFTISGSDFVEMFVGVGASRVRDLFEQAKVKAPCIVFIDELDAIGRQRGVHMGAVNDEREQTLNQLLVEMDGFDPNVGVIILAATNRPEVLDRALLRPGRFDRQVVVDAPDVDGREQILKVHVRNKPLAADVDLRRIAQGTPGFSGADLANAVNEAALLAVRRGHKEISQLDLEEAVEKVVAGPERRSRRLNDEVKRRVAYHEVGHALVAAYSEHADPVHKISIVPRGHMALGYTLQLPTEEQYLMTEAELRDRLRGLLGGRAAEQVIFDEISTGAQNDLERATAMSRQMVAMFGMSEKVGLMHCAQQPNQYLPGMDGMQRDCSEETAREIDEEVKAMLDQCYGEAIAILTEHRDQLEEVAAELLKHETLDRATFERMVGRKIPAPDPRAVAASHG